MLSAFVVRLIRNSSTAKRIGLAASGAVLIGGVIIFLSTEANSLTGLPGVRLLAEAGLAADGLSAVLLPLVAALCFATLLASPRSDLTPLRIAGLLWAQACSIAVLESANIVLLGSAWALINVPLLYEGETTNDRALKRAIRWMTFTSVAPTSIALLWLIVISGGNQFEKTFDIGTLASSPMVAPWAPYISVLLLIGAVARMGVAPLHLWVPVVFERAPVPWVLSSSVSPLGSFAIARLAIAICPTLFNTYAPYTVVWGAFAALYGAVLALGQNNARRLLGYLWVSLSGVVCSALLSMSSLGISGALLHDIAITTSVSGLLLIVRATESRTGTSDMRRLGGLVKKAPRLTTAFLLLAVAALGLPGTVSFVSEDLLIQGLLHDYAFATVIIVTIMALNGVTLLRAFKRIFLGSGTAQSVDIRRVEDVLFREQLTVFALLFALLAGGVVPTPVIAIRQGVIDSLRNTDVNTHPHLHSTANSICISQSHHG